MQVPKPPSPPISVTAVAVAPTKCDIPPTRGQTVAIKKLHNQHLSGDKLEELKKEVQIQR
jgi:hypothetical protein